MNKDNHNITHIYDLINSDFIWNLDNLNIDLFLDHYEIHKLVICEDFKFVSKKSIPNGESYEYLLTAPDGSYFNLQFNLVKNSSKIFEHIMLVNDAKRLESSEYVNFVDISEKINNSEEKYGLYIIFTDSDGNTKLTFLNKKNNAFIVFKSIQYAFKDFIYRDNNLEIVNNVKFYVDVNETKRIDIYEKLIQRIYSYFNLKNKFIDKISSNNYYLVTLY